MSIFEIVVIIVSVIIVICGIIIYVNNLKHGKCSCGCDNCSKSCKHYIKNKKEN